MLHIRNQKTVITHLAVAFALLLSLGAALAQTRFSFAGLQWRSSIEDVETSLKKQSFSGFSAIQKLSCKVQTVCEMKFTGPPIKAGSAWFRDGLLIEVDVVPQDFETTLRALKSKYGEPIASKDKSLLSLLRLRWESPTGETLEIFSETIVYNMNSKPVQQDTSKF
jgi:hypothetical protein